MRTEEREGARSGAIAFSERSHRDALMGTIVRGRPLPDVDVDVGGGDDDVDHWRWADGTQSEIDVSASQTKKDHYLKRIARLHLKWANVLIAKLMDDGEIEALIFLWGVEGPLR